MSTAIGIDIGGTKIAVAAFDAVGKELAMVSVATPNDYGVFLDSCASAIASVEAQTGSGETIGLGTTGTFDRETGTMQIVPNVLCLEEKPLRSDLEARVGRKVILENDAACAALAEAIEGPGHGFQSVFGLILGTGVGGGFVYNGKVLTGANGLCGEIGHLPFPQYEEADGVWGRCGCGRMGCIETFISGGGLARLYHRETGIQADARAIGSLALIGDAGALQTIDRYYTLVAKAMTVVLHSFDPDIIIVSGGLNALPGLYDKVPERWGTYALCCNPKTAFVPASFGALAGLRGAALIGMRGPSPR